MKKAKRVCLTSTPYSLFLYLMFSTLAEIKETYFIFSTGIPTNLAKKFSNSCSIDNIKILFGIKIKQWLYCFFLRKFKFRFIGKHTKIFAQDHLISSPSVIYNRDYILIEDCPYITSIIRRSNRYKIYEQRKKKKRYKILKFLYGDLLYSGYGNNVWCKGIIMSVNDEYVDFLEGKKRYICDLYETWAYLSQEKRDYILSVFDISNEEIEKLKKYKNILYTQPLFPDCLEEEEHKILFSKIIANYSKENLIIKKHPRDTCDYTALSPGVNVFDKDLPSQMLEMLGIKFDLAITVFSSSVSNINYPIDIDWYGTECHPKLLEKYGVIKPPIKVNKRHV